VNDFTSYTSIPYVAVTGQAFISQLLNVFNERYNALFLRRVGGLCAHFFMQSCSEFPQKYPGIVHCGLSCDNQARAKQEVLM